MAIKKEVLDELMAGYERPEDLLGDEGLFKQLKKALLERAHGAELTHHLGYEKGDCSATIRVGVARHQDERGFGAVT